MKSVVMDNLDYSDLPLTGQTADKMWCLENKNKNKKVS